MKNFFWYCLNTTVRKFNNTNIGAVNVIQKKFFYLHEIGEQIKRSSSFSFYLPTIQLIISIRGKSYEDIYHSPPHASVITGNILIRIIIFFRYHLLASSTLCRHNSDLSKLDWTLQLFNFSDIRNLANTRTLFSIPVAKYASFSHQARTLKTNLLGLISNFSKYYFKTGTICLLFLSSCVFTVLELDSNHFGILLWKIVKPRDHNVI